MQVVILCGGMGTRIRGVSDELPKPMLPLGNRPILWHIMRSYAAYGHREFVLCLGYKGDVIRDYFMNYRLRSNDVTVHLGSRQDIEIHHSTEEENWKVTLVETGEQTQTGGRLSIASKYLEVGKPFCLTYGDGVSSVNLNQLEDFHSSSKRIATVTGVRPPGRFGEIESLDNGTVIGFNEKPQTSAGRISGGFFVFDYKFLEYLDGSQNLVLEEEPMKKLVIDNQLGVFNFDGFWQCMDTPRDWNYLNDLFANGETPWLDK